MVRRRRLPLQTRRVPNFQRAVPMASCRRICVIAKANAKVAPDSFFAPHSRPYGFNSIRKPAWAKWLSLVSAAVRPRDCITTKLTQSVNDHALSE